MALNAKSVRNGLLSDYTASIILLVVSMASVPITLRYLSLSDYGGWLAVSAAVAIVSIADIGFPMYATKRLSAGDGSWKGTCSFLQTAQFVQTALSLGLTAIAIAGTSLYFNNNFNSEPPAGLQEAAYLCIAALGLDILFGLNHSLLIAHGNILFINSMLFIRQFISIALPLGLLHFGRGIESFGYGQLIGTILMQFSVFAYRIKKVPGYSLKPRWKTADREELSEGFKYIFNFQIVRLSQIAKTGGLPILLTTVAGPEFLARYSITSKLPQLVASYFSKLGSALFPYLSKASNGLNNNSQKTALLVVSGRVISVSMIAIWLHSDTFVSLWVDNQASLTGFLLMLICLQMARDSLFGINGTFIYASGVYGALPRLVVIELMIFAAFFLLALKFDNAGIVLLGYLLGGMPSMAYSVIRAQHGVKWRHRSSLKLVVTYIIWPTLASFAIGAYVSEYCNVASWVSVIGQIVIIVVVNVASREGVRFAMSPLSTLKSRMIDSFRVLP